MTNVRVDCRTLPLKTERLRRKVTVILQATAAAREIISEDATMVAVLSKADGIYESRERH